MAFVMKSARSRARSHHDKSSQEQCDDGDVPVALRGMRGELRWLHVVPGLRHALVLSSVTQEDVDAIFRVHRLTFFLFCVLPMFVLAILGFQDENPLYPSQWAMDYVALVSCGVSLCLEIVSFSSFVRILKQSIKIEAMEHNRKSTSLRQKASWMVLVYNLAKPHASRVFDDKSSSGSRRSSRCSTRCSSAGRNTAFNRGLWGEEEPTEIVTFREKIHLDIVWYMGEKYQGDHAFLRLFDLTHQEDLRNQLLRRHIHYGDYIE